MYLQGYCIKRYNNFLEYLKWANQEVIKIYPNGGIYQKRKIEGLGCSNLNFILPKETRHVFIVVCGIDTAATWSRMAVSRNWKCQVYATLPAAYGCWVNKYTQKSECLKNLALKILYREITGFIPAVVKTVLHSNGLEAFNVVGGAKRVAVSSKAVGQIGTRIHFATSSSALRYV